MVMRVPRSWAYVVAEPGQQGFELAGFGVGEAGAQSLVEGRGRVPQAEEERVAVGGQLDQVQAAVRRIPAPGHQPGGLHRVQVMGERGSLDPDRLGELALTGELAALQRDQHQPDRQRSARLGQGVVEGAADGPGDPGEVQAKRLVRGTGHERRVTLLDSPLIV